MTNYPKRLIEVDLPIKRISEHARREKSIRHGHISTLHIWWARRPLAACRAVICAALWPDPADPLCPQAFRDRAAELITDFAQRAVTDNELAGSCAPDTWSRWLFLAKPENRIDPTRDAHLNVLRNLLLDFIADFANWDNSTKEAYLTTSRALTQAAHEALGGEPGTRPLVVDPFAGGGAIPLEALRVGADAFASDLNPVAVLLNKVVLEYIPKYGQQLADEVRKWGAWIKQEAEKELAEFYPKDPDGATPIAYLWARTIQCEGPKCGIKIPLIRNTQITREGRKWHVNLIASKEGVTITVNEGKLSNSKPTVKGGSATCPRNECGHTTSAKSVKEQLIHQNGGAQHATLFAVYVNSEIGRYFRNSSNEDHEAIVNSKRKLDRCLLPQEEINPIRPYKNTRGLSAVTRIGLRTFGDLYTARQAIAINCFYKLLSKAIIEGVSEEFKIAILTTLQCAASRFIFQNNSLSRWNSARSTIEGAFGKQALQVVWDFAESNPISSGPANWDGAIEWVIKVIEANSCITTSAIVNRNAAQYQVLPDDSAQMLMTDPPYFAAIPYSDLSNVFYVWERNFIQDFHTDLRADGLVSQQEEIIVTNANLDKDGNSKTAEFFQREMRKALSSARQTLIPSGIGIIVFADSSTESWEAIIGAVIESGWIITGSWPIDTELQNRTQASGSASLQSSVHLVCRPRENADGSLQADNVGDYRDVLHELPLRIREWMPRLAAEGVVGADAIFACLGPALEIFSRYARVEKVSGEQVLLREYLEQVWAAVSKEALNMIFAGADATGLDSDARLTAMWFWTLSANAEGGTQKAEAEEESESGEEEESDNAKKTAPGYTLEFDAARKIAQGLGAHLEDLHSVIEIKGDKARLLSVAERARHLFGKQDLDATPARKKKAPQAELFDLQTLPGEEGSSTAVKLQAGATVLDRIHQAMLLFSAGRSEALKRFLVEDGIGRDQRFWRLADALSKLYPVSSDEKRWVDGVLARKKGLGF